MAAVIVGLPRCAAAADLEDWLRQALGPFYRLGSEPLLAAELATMLADIPVLVDAAASDRVWSGRLGDVACWELHDAPTT
jgi:hypothetical protein